MNLNKQKIAYFVADTVVAGVTKKLLEKALYSLAPEMEDREITSNLITGGGCMVITSALDTPVHNVVDAAMAKFDAFKAKKKTTDTTTD